MFINYCTIQYGMVWYGMAWHGMVYNNVRTLLICLYPWISCFYVLQLFFLCLQIYETLRRTLHFSCAGNYQINYILMDGAILKCGILFTLSMKCF